MAALAVSLACAVAVLAQDTPGPGAGTPGPGKGKGGKGGKGKAKEASAPAPRNAAGRVVLGPGAAGRGFWGGGGLDARFDFYPMSFAMEGLPSDVPRYGNGFRRFLAEAFTRTMTVLSHTTSLPFEKHGFDLDPDVKDAWGLPALRMTYQSPDDDMKTMRWLLDRQVEILEAAGAKKVWKLPVEPVTFTVHIMGTARMGNDPKRSVVNREHQTHDVKNLYLVDGSSFVTSARQQPTATIQALAFRAAELMGKRAKGGGMGKGSD